MFIWQMEVVTGRLFISGSLDLFIPNGENLMVKSHDQLQPSTFGKEVVLSRQRHRL
jgi:hypothetical protein